jgi:hypothetical protein
MNQYSHLTHTSLLDMLVRYTAEYTQMLADNNKSYEFYKCRRLVEQLTEELELRMRETPPGPAVKPPANKDNEESPDPNKAISKTG